MGLFSLWELSARYALSTANYSIVFVYCICYSLSDICFARSCIFLWLLTCAKYKFNAPDVTKTPGGCNKDTKLSGGLISTCQTTLGCKKYEPYTSQWIYSQMPPNMIYFIVRTHRENSSVTQTTPEPTLLSWGGWPRGKIFPHPWPLGKPGLIALIRPLRPYCSQALWFCSGVSWK